MGKKARKNRVIARKKQAQRTPKAEKKGSSRKKADEKENIFHEEIPIIETTGPLRIDKFTSLPLCEADRMCQTIWYACKKCFRVYSTASERDAHRRVHKSGPSKSKDESKSSTKRKSVKEAIPAVEAAPTPTTRRSSRMASVIEVPVLEPLADISANSKADTSAASSTSARGRASRNPDSSQLMCDVCFRLFSSRKDLKIHVAQHNTTKAEKAIHLGRKMGKLSTLGFLADQDDSTPYDVDEPSGKAQASYTCKVCSKTFGIEKNLARHMKTHPETPAVKTSLRRTTRKVGDQLTKGALENLMRLKKHERSSLSPMSP